MATKIKNLYTLIVNSLMESAERRASTIIQDRYRWYV